MNIVDSQVHIWNVETPDRPWPPGRAHEAQKPYPTSKETLLFQMVQGSGKPLSHIHSELPLEILPVDAPELHLKNELPNHPLLLGRRSPAKAAPRLGHRRGYCRHITE